MWAVMVTFYATVSAGDDRPELMPPGAYLFPASSFSLPRFKFRAPRIPEGCDNIAADCGGFVAMKKWNGEYQYSPEEYVDWLSKFTTLSWAATMDWCCEPDIAHNQSAIQERQLKTTDSARMFFSKYRECPWAWVPTVQGWQVPDYVRHARQLAPLVAEMRLYYRENQAWRVGIGTLCQRADARMIREVARAVACELPGIPLHLWGVKTAALKSQEALPDAVISTDSAAWNNLFFKGREEFHKSGMSQREYVYKVALPRYLSRLDAALEKPKQRCISIDIDGNLYWEDPYGPAG